MRQNSGVPVENGLLGQLKKNRHFAKYAHLKKISEVLVMAVIGVEGEIEGKFIPGRRRTAWIDELRIWTH